MSEIAKALSAIPRDDMVRAKRHASGAWTPERERQLTILWAQGLSASQIAKQIGGVTRNAVIGKRIRMGLPDRVTTQRVQRTGKRRVHDSQPKKVTKLPGFKPDNHRAKGARPSEHNIPHRKAVVGVHCELFLEGQEGADGLVCGRAVQPGYSWCCEHFSLVYVPVRERAG